MLLTFLLIVISLTFLLFAMRLTFLLITLINKRLSLGLQPSGARKETLTLYVG